MSTILIVDDDQQLRQSFQRLLEEEGYGVLTAGAGKEGVSQARTANPDLVVMDVRMPGMSGLEAFREIQAIHPRLPVIVMTAFGTTETAIEATKLGAYDYILKPFEIPEILQLIEQALATSQMMRRHVELGAEKNSVGTEAVGDVGGRRASAGEALVGNSSSMQEVYKTIGRVAPTGATVLIRGESGTGKELVARAIYQHGGRAQRPFLVINCVAIPETLLESELFGYEKGAFTGAVARRLGRIERASGGTVFLDEIGDMPLALQAKVLRLLQEKSIERLGGRDTIPVDVRIIAATNRNLEEALAAGQFREDLYYRLKVVELTLPPLRERKEDIPLLCHYFLARQAQELGTDDPGVAGEALAALCQHDWPGNVRELENTLNRALILGRGGSLALEGICQALAGASAEAPGAEGFPEKKLRKWLRGVLASGPNPELYASLIERFSSLVLSEALTATDGNRTQAARLLGLSRPTLQSKIEKHCLKSETTVTPDRSTES